MKYICLLTVILISFVACNTSKLISTSHLERKNYQEIILPLVDEKLRPDVSAMYPNGINGILNHISKTIKYPKNARLNEIEGKVIVEYIVGSDGRIVETKIIQSVSPDIDKEAIRVILSLERFYPGFKDGKPVRIRFTQPIVFKLT